MINTRIGLVKLIKEILSSKGYKTRPAIARLSKEFYGYYLSVKPQGVEYLWFGFLNYKEARGFFIGAATFSMEAGTKLFDEGFKLFPVWKKPFWFIKRLISDKNIEALKTKSDNQQREIIDALLNNTYPF